jgi:hypothetical protein
MSELYPPMDNPLILREKQDDLAQYLREQREWSTRTFGPNYRTTGLLKHIQKELEEIAANPTDLVEWIDVILLACDGYWRHGGEPENLMRDIRAKFEKNRNRQWSPPRDDEPSEHIRDNPALSDDMIRRGYR